MHIWQVRRRIYNTGHQNSCIFTLDIAQMFSPESSEQDLSNCTSVLRCSVIHVCLLNWLSMFDLVAQLLRSWFIVDFHAFFGIFIVWSESWVHTGLRFRLSLSNLILVYSYHVAICAQKYLTNYCQPSSFRITCSERETTWRETVDIYTHSMSLWAEQCWCKWCRHLSESEKVCWICKEHRKGEHVAVIWWQGKPKCVLHIMVTTNRKLLGSVTFWEYT